MNQARGQVSEQAYMTQRNIQNQAQSRGLGSSGLTNLAGFQAQQQAGQAISDIEQQNQAVQGEAMNVRRSLMNELSGATRSADLTYAQQIAENDERQFQQERSLREFDVNFLSTLAELSNAGQGNLAQQLASAYYSGDIDTSPEGIAEFIKGTDPLNQYDPTLMERIGLGGSADAKRNMANVQEVGGGALAGLSAAAMFIPGAQGLGLAGGLAGTGSMAMAKNADIWRDSGNQTYTIGSNQITTTSREDAKQQITQALSQMNSQVASGAIKVSVGRFGHITFSVGDTKKQYKTLGEAVQALRDKLGQQ